MCKPECVHHKVRAEGAQGTSPPALSLNTEARPWLHWLGLALTPISRKGSCLYGRRGCEEEPWRNGEEKEPVIHSCDPFFSSHGMRVVWPWGGHGLSSMTEIHDLKVSHQNFNNRRAGLKEPILSSVSAVEHARACALVIRSSRGLCLFRFLRKCSQSHSESEKSEAHAPSPIH